jgi:hypothetical protein
MLSDVPFSVSWNDPVVLGQVMPGQVMPPVVYQLMGA